MASRPFKPFACATFRHTLHGWREVPEPSIWSFEYQTHSHTGRIGCSLSRTRLLEGASRHPGPAGTKGQWPGPTRGATMRPAASQRRVGRRAASMGEIETDYLVVGAGASGMAFVDALVAESDVDVVLVDRRDRPGGHWLDSYSFVQLHQPSAYYGVTSTVLGADRIDDSGPNAGFYERARSDEICDYFARVLEALVASGRVHFQRMSEYRGQDADGHHVVSMLTGAETTIKVRGKLVDATYVESSIPSRHTPSFVVDPDVPMISPNDLVDLGEAPSRFTVLGAGKTAMDTCSWLLDAGVDPDAIRWVRPRDPWLFNRAFMQPLELVGSYMQLQARWVEEAAKAEDGVDFGRRLEQRDVFLRIDPDLEPEMFRGATISKLEIDALRSIEQVVRNGKIRRIGPDRITFVDGEIPADPRDLYVNCTAAGVRPTVPRPVFEHGKITIQYVTIGIVPWSAATIGAVEASRDDDADKNELCPPVIFSGNVADILDLSLAGMTGLSLRATDQVVADWNARCRLDPARGAVDHMDDPQVAEAFASIGANFGAALENLASKTVGNAALP